MIDSEYKLYCITNFQTLSPTYMYPLDVATSILVTDVGDEMCC